MSVSWRKVSKSSQNFAGIVFADVIVVAGDRKKIEK
jgi:hypothetical protein